MFTHIETLIALATTGSMTRAATHLRVTQSTVSSLKPLPLTPPVRPYRYSPSSPDRQLGAYCSDACADRASDGALLSKSAAPCNPSPASCKWPATASATAWYPRDVARARGIRPRQLVHLPEPILTRPVSLIGRPTNLSLPVVQHFYQALRQNIKA